MSIHEAKKNFYKLKLLMEQADKTVIQIMSHPQTTANQIMETQQKLVKMKQMFRDVEKSMWGFL